MSWRLLEKVKRFIKKCASDPFYMDMYFFCRFSDFSRSEYRQYHFQDHLFGRRAFVSYKECTRIFRQYNSVIMNKREVFLLLQEYYGRDCCLLDKTRYENEQLLRSFTEKHPDFIAKAYDGSSGQGIARYEARHSDEWIPVFLDTYSNGCLLEALIEQTPELAEIHPWSVNTLRVTTVNYGDHIEAIYPVMRFGTGHAYTDNRRGSSLLCAVDTISCKIFSAIDANGDDHITHPDTGVSIVGLFIPELQSAMNLAKGLAQFFPENVFTGFDFAHTKNGWILVEANTETRFTVWQIPYRKGFRRELSKIPKRCTKDT